MIDQEADKMLPFGDIWAYYNEVCGAPQEGKEYSAEVARYWDEVQSKRS